MQRTLIVLVLGLLAVGCGEDKQPSKELTLEEQKALRDSVAGEYVNTDKGITLKWVFLENGIKELQIRFKLSSNFRKQPELSKKWKISNGEIHIILNPEFIDIYRINPDKSITNIASIIDGKRKDFTKEDQSTWKKIK